MIDLSRTNGCGLSHLCLVAAGLSAAAGSLELAADRADIGLGVSGAGGAKVLDGLAGHLGATQQHAVGASGALERQLIKGHAGAASLDDAGASTLGEAQRGNGHGGELMRQKEKNSTRPHTNTTTTTTTHILVNANIQNTG
jgi:hypothetical protein